MELADPHDNIRATIMNRDQFYQAVGDAGGEVIRYFRDYYQDSVPDLTLCVPLTSAYLLNGAERFLEDLDREGFGPVTAVRVELDRLREQADRLQERLASVDTKLENFDDDYWNVNHGPTHHAVKQRELRQLRDDQTDLRRQIESLMSQTVARVWQGRAGQPVGARTVTVAGLLRHQITREGKWSLTLNVEGGAGHALAIERDAGGRITLFDPDWAIVSLPNVDALANLLGALLAGHQEMLNGTSVLAPVN